MDLRIAGIAIRREPRGLPETLSSSDVTVAEGLPGNYRGRERSRRLRQVTLLHARDWEAACDESACGLDWTARRCDLLVDGTDDLPAEVGALLRIGTAVLEITGECDPCVRMDAVHPGLRAALAPGWRGGRLARVVEEGRLEVGSPVLTVPGTTS